jgi:hypothetical protein
MSICLLKISFPKREHIYRIRKVLTIRTNSYAAEKRLLGDNKKITKFFTISIMTLIGHVPHVLCHL